MKILVGLSGGVDSAVTAHLLKEAGHDVTCAFMRNWDSLTNNDIFGNPYINDDMCTQEVDYEDALAVANHLGLELIRVDYVKEYWDNVFERFLEETKLGYTPNPDILCNQFIKFDAFFDYMDSHGFDMLATGHYAQTDGTHLIRGIDTNKDQTYFLSRINPSVLNRVIFPLGNLDKTEVREIASTLDLPVAKKKDSTGICFIGERNYKEFLLNYLKDSEGDIINIDTNEVIGRHSGVMFYTIGQRHGLNISAHVGPWFVVGKNLTTKELYVGKGKDHPELFISKCIIDNLNWYNEKEDLSDIAAKFRYRQKDKSVNIEFLEDGTLEVIPNEPISAVTMGQEAVFYNGKICLGGGRISRVFNTRGDEIFYDAKP